MVPSGLLPARSLIIFFFVFLFVFVIAAAATLPAYSSFSSPHQTLPNCKKSVTGDPLETRSPMSFAQFCLQ